MVTAFPFWKHTDGIAKFQSLRCEDVRFWNSYLRRAIENPYIHEVRHDLCIIDLGVLRTVIPSPNRHSPGRLDEPTGKCPPAELGSLCSETDQAAFLR